MDLIGNVTLKETSDELKFPKPGHWNWGHVKELAQMIWQSSIIDAWSHITKSEQTMQYILTMNHELQLINSCLCSIFNTNEPFNYFVLHGSNKTYGNIR